MTRSRNVALLLGVLIALSASMALAEKGREGDEEAFDHTIIIGLGGAGELELPEGSAHAGGSLFVEWEAIDRWLELELGASVLAAEGGVEVPIDLLFKKPFRLSRSIEVMVGLGPEVVRVSTPAKKTTLIGVEFAVDFMLWPSQHVGLWVEPTYGVVFNSAARSGLACTAGIIFGW